MKFEWIGTPQVSFQFGTRLKPGQVYEADSAEMKKAAEAWIKTGWAKPVKAEKKKEGE